MEGTYSNMEKKEFSQDYFFVVRDGMAEHRLVTSLAKKLIFFLDSC
jgi:hypothetical protein